MPIRIAQRGIRKAKNVVRSVGVEYLPATIVGGLTRRREFPEVLVTKASAIKKKVPAAKRKRVPNKFILRDVKWGEVVESATDKNLHPTIKDMFVRGCHYSQTAQWRTMIQAVDDFVAGKIDDPAKHGAYWCKSREDVTRYFAILLECYRSIKDNSYKTQSELLEEAGTIDAGGMVRRRDDEVEVLIDASGDLVFSGAWGNHRFAIAQVLNVRRLPVILGGVDASYMAQVSTQRSISCRSLFQECVHSHDALDFLE